MDDNETIEETGDRVNNHVKAMAEENNARLSALAAQGLLPTEAELLKVRLDAVTDFTVGVAVRLALEAHYQQSMSQFIDFVESRANAEKLTSGVAEGIRNLHNG